MQALALPAADAALETWVNGFGFVHMSEEQQTVVKKELRMLIFPGTQLLVKPLPQRNAAEAAEPASNPGAAATADPGVLEASQAACAAAAKIAAETAATAESAEPAAAAAFGQQPPPLQQQQAMVSLPMVGNPLLGGPGVAGAAVSQPQLSLQQQIMQQQVLFTVQQQAVGLPQLHSLQGPLAPVSLNNILTAQGALGGAVNGGQAAGPMLLPGPISSGLPAPQLGLLPLCAPNGVDASLRRSTPPADVPQMQLQLPSHQPAAMPQPSAAMLWQPQQGFQQQLVEQQQLSGLAPPPQQRSVGQAAAGTFGGAFSSGFVAELQQQDLQPQQQQQPPGFATVKTEQPQQLPSCIEQPQQQEGFVGQLPGAQEVLLQHASDMQPKPEVDQAQVQANVGSGFPPVSL